MQVDQQLESDVPVWLRIIDREHRHDPEEARREKLWVLDGLKDVFDRCGRDATELEELRARVQSGEI